MTPRVIVRWLLLAAMCTVMFLLGQQSTRWHHTPPEVTVLHFQANGNTWIVPCVLPDWPYGAISCDWEGATETHDSQGGAI
jgi:hypothetical protein